MAGVALVVVGMLAPASLAQRAAVAAPTSTSAATAPAPDIEAQFVSRINSLRASKGLSQLQVSNQVTGVARAWTERMVGDGGISHNPNLAHELEGDWTKAGENVGVGYSVDSLMQAFVDSPAHYRNLVDPGWNYVGVGVTLSPDGRIWTTHNFLTLPQTTTPASPAPTAAPARATAPGPGRAAATTPTTSAASTTTTVAPAASPSDPDATTPRATAERVGTILVELRSLEGV